MKTTIIAAALAFASLTAILPAQADNGSQSVPQIRVPYGDLNLSSPAGARAMLNRIRGAAVRVCGGNPDNRELKEKQFYRSCVRAAVDNAVAQLNAPWVTALHAGRPYSDPRFAQGRKTN